LPSGYILAYDAGCGPCSRFKAVVDFLDAKGLIEFVTLEHAEKAGTLEDIDPSLRYRSFHLMAPGRGPLSGADALLPLVKLLLPGGRVISKAIEVIPGSRRSISFGYSALSRLHDAGACGTTAH
jgi:predicted DCC family thiol-disulfide oxidoreductase YuxK